MTLRDGFVTKDYNEIVFNQIMLESIDESLTLLGKDAKNAIHFYLEVHNINREQIPYKINEFSTILEKLLGVGARLIELNIMKKLHVKIGIEWSWKQQNPWALPDLTFKEYVEKAKAQFSNTKFNPETGILLTEKEAMEKYK